MSFTDPSTSSYLSVRACQVVGWKAVAGFDSLSASRVAVVGHFAERPLLGWNARTADWEAIPETVRD